VSKIVKYGDLVAKIDDGEVIVTKNGGDGTILRFTREEWEVFIAGIRDGDFHFDQPSFTFIEEDK
jgi:NAD kinase